MNKLQKDKDRKLLETADQTVKILKTFAAEGKDPDSARVRVVDKDTNDVAEYTIEEWIIEDLLDIDAKGWNRGFVMGSIFTLILSLLCAALFL